MGKRLKEGNVIRTIAIPSDRAQEEEEEYCRPDSISFLFVHFSNFLQTAHRRFEKKSRP